MTEEKKTVISGEEQAQTESLNTQEIIDQLEEKRNDEFVLAPHITISCIVGLDSQRRLNRSGWSCFLTAQVLPEGVAVFDLEGKEIDLSLLSQPLEINKVKKAQFQGEDFLLSRDAWGNPDTYSLKESPEKPDLQTKVKEGLAKSIELWEAAVQGEDQIRAKVKEIYGEEVVATIDGLIRALEQNPVIQDEKYWIKNVDLWDIAYQGKTVDGALKILKGEIRGHRMPYDFEKTAEFQNCKKIIEKIILHQPLTQEEKFFADAVKISPIATQKSIRDSDRWRINDFTRRYVIANIAENLVCREAVGWDIYQKHQEHFASFIKKLSEAYEVPSWFTPYAGNEFTWGFSLDRTVANANGNYFLDASSNTEGIAAVLDHERGHRLKSEVRDAGSAASWQRERDTGLKLEYENYEESFVESMALLIRNLGNIDAAMKENVNNPISYKRGVEQFLNILKEIEEVNPEQMFASKLMVDGFKKIADGQTAASSIAVKEYYDQHVAKRPGAFDEKMEKYSDNNVLRSQWRGDSGDEEQDTPEFNKFILNAIEAVQWSDLSELEVENFRRGKDGFEDEKKWQMDTQRRDPSTILDLKPSILMIRTLEALKANPKMKAEFQAYIDQPFKNYATALSEWLKSGEKKTVN